MTIWGLRGRLAAAVLAVPLALGACDKKDRKTETPQRQPVSADAALGTTSAPDAAIAATTLSKPYRPEVDGDTPQGVKGGCNTLAECIPEPQARAANKSAGTLPPGCPDAVDAVRAGLQLNGDTAPLLEKVTDAERGRGKQGTCCYGEQVCGKGRPARERGVARVARARRGSAWS